MITENLSLEDLRMEITLADKKISEILAKRMVLSAVIGKIKGMSSINILDENREKYVLNNAQNTAKQHLCNILTYLKENPSNSDIINSKSIQEDSKIRELLSSIDRNLLEKELQNQIADIYSVLFLYSKKVQKQ